MALVVAALLAASVGVKLLLPEVQLLANLVERRQQVSFPAKTS